MPGVGPPGRAVACAAVFHPHPEVAVPLVSLSRPADGVVLLTLDDPERRNAMGWRMGDDVRSAVAEVAADRSARVLVVTGAGSTFCAGADLPELFGDPDRPVDEVHADLQRYYRAFLDVADVDLVTVAAVNGPAVGAGLNLAMACDLRVAGPSATFGATFSRIGLHPGGGCTWFLVRALGPSRALRTLLLGEVLDAERAVAWGLAEGPEPDPLAAAVDLAGRIAGVDAGLARMIRRTVRVAASTDDREAVLELESWAQAASASSDALREWVARFAE